MRRPIHGAVAALDRSVSLNACDLCGGRESFPVAQTDRTGQPLDTKVCRGCGLVSHRIIPSDSQLADYYRRFYREHYQSEKSPSNRHVLRAWLRAERAYRRLAPFLNPGDSVLDAGAGIGCLVKRFERAGFHVMGIEPGAGFQQFAREKLRANVWRRTLHDLPTQPSFDLICLSHVIEHLRSPKTALSQLHRTLRKGGRLYVECPNLAAPFARYDRLFHVAHIHNFTPDNLLALASNCGFEVLHVFGHGRSANLKILFKKGTPAPLRVMPDSCQTTLAALRRARPVPYYFRWNYLGTRVWKLIQYAHELVTADRTVRSLLKQFETTPAIWQNRLPLRNCRPQEWTDVSTVNTPAHVKKRRN